MKKVLNLAVSLTVGLFWATMASAVQPQNGFWAIEGELNGQPGRGFQVDVQGDTLIFSYYGYRPDGSATFYLASGKYENNSYTGRLVEYQGGTSIGQAFRNGTESSSPGNFNIRFIDSTKGFLSLPGEETKNISRFTFHDSSVSLNNSTLDGKTYGVGPFSVDSSKFSFTAKDGVFALRREAFFSGTCLFDGKYTVNGSDLESSGTYRCADFSNGTYIAKNVSIDENGLYRATFYKVVAGTDQTIVEYHTGR